MILVDTNILSAVMQPDPDPAVLAWLDRFPRQSIWTTAINVFELRYGLERLTAGAKRLWLEEAFGKVVDTDFDGRILPFDDAAARAAAVLAVQCRRTGRGIELNDLQIAAIAIVAGASLATRNTRHFSNLGLPLINPWTA